MGRAKFGSMGSVIRTCNWGNAKLGGELLEGRRFCVLGLLGNDRSFGGNLWRVC